MRCCARWVGPERGPCAPALMFCIKLRDCHLPFQTTNFCTTTSHICAHVFHLSSSLAVGALIDDSYVGTYCSVLASEGGALVMLSQKGFFGKDQFPTNRDDNKPLDPLMEKVVGFGAGEGNVATGMASW